jgi:CDGSH-type Zn-finger protein
MDPNQKAHITPSLDGPYWVTDLTRFANRTGPMRIRPSMALCRCGVSANKPFCDGAHVKIGFSSANRAAAGGARTPAADLAVFADLPPPDGNDEPAIFVAPDGPYLVTGAPELRNTVFGPGASTERFALCRCGGSSSKPFCDGTHRRIGFKDERN